MSKVAKKVFKPVAKIVNKIPGGNILASAALAASGNPQLIPFLNAATTIGSGGSLLQGALSGAGSYLGGKFGQNIFGDLGTVGQAAGNVFGVDNVANFTSGLLGSQSANILSDLATTPLSSALGGFAGNALADNVSGFSADQANASMGSKLSGPSLPAPFKATRDAEQETPASLSALGGLNPMQQSSNLATQGVYGGGLGPDEQSYFTNLINRRLVDESGKVGDVSNINPIESSYLQQLGLGGYKDSNNLLEQISKWKTQRAA